MGRALGAGLVVPVLGNHDVESQGSSIREPMYIARNLRPGFPFESELARQSFFSDGYCILPAGADTQIVAVNTVIDHRDATSAERGAFDIARIDRLREALQRDLNRTVRLAVMHHHPVLHTSHYFTDEDVIPTGEALMNALRDGGCRLVVHGHKHVAHLRCVDGVAVFAAGSFSAMLQEYATSTGNMFHVMEIEAEPGNASSLRGTINTWVFHFARGWGRASEEHSGFPFVAGFGSRLAVESIVTGLIGIANADMGRSRFQEAQVLGAVPDLRHLTPAESGDLKSRLAQNGLELADMGRGNFDLWRIFNAS